MQEVVEVLPRDKLFDPAQSIEGHVPELDDGGIAVGSHCNLVRKSKDNNKKIKISLFPKKVVINCKNMEGKNTYIQLFAEEHEHFTQLLAVNTEVLLETSRGKSNESFLMDELQAANFQTSNTFEYL